jgi:hypothetical protein
MTKSQAKAKTKFAKHQSAVWDFERRGFPWSLAFGIWDFGA